MKIVGFTVRLECDYCAGEKLVKPPNRAILRACGKCHGHGHIEGFVAWADFEKLIHGVVDAAVQRTISLLKGRWRG